MQHSRQGFRLSPQQQRLWLLQQESDVYRAQCVMMLTGELELAGLEEALRQVVRRHEMLRTTFYRHHEMKFPVQCVADSHLPLWYTVDLKSWSGPQQTTLIEALCRQERRQPFDLEHGPLLRVLLLSLSPSRHGLLLSLPALYADAWTLRHLLHEISQAYTACRQGTPLSDEPIQYVQFSEWQNALLEDEDAETGKDYWCKQGLHTLPAVTLAFARQVDGTPGFAPEVFVTMLEPELVAQMRACGQQDNTSLPAFLLAAWQTLLWRLSGQPDILVGYVCDGRKYADLHGVLGLLSKWVPVYGHFEEHYTYREIVERLQSSMADASLWQEYFLRQEGDGASAGAVPMPIGFAFEADLAPRHVAGMSWTLDQQYVCGDRFTVHLVCVQQDERLLAAFYYDTNLFDGQDIACLAEQWQTLLGNASSKPEAMLGTLGMLSHAERQRLLVEINDTSTTFPTDICIHHLFETQVARTPDMVAVVYEEQSLTYAVLNARANQLAHYLHRLGVGPELPVALCLERSPEMLVGLLGILKAGAAYVPLEPGQPPERLALLLADVQTPVVLTQERFDGVFAAARAQIICLDRDCSVMARESDKNLRREATGKHLVYVMYTSGSTGRPKGVAVEHRQLLNYLYAIRARLELPSPASFAALSTFAADLGHTTVFPALCWGGCLHIVSAERAFTPEALAEYFNRQPIDCLKIVPSHLAALLTWAHPAQVLPRQRLILGGEASTWEMLETVQTLAPECRIYNHYGPTEATVGTLAWQVEHRAGRRQTGPLPLSRPLANMQGYVLDAYLQPMPVGVPGELCLAGAGLARGYLHDSRLTAARFVPHPHSTTAGARLYKTGDRGRFLPDGSIEFLGRFDQQVKLRGFRIELGEIETVLSQHPGVREVVVVTRQDTPGNTRLVAYVVPNQQQVPTVEELRRMGQAQLPDYMVPAAFAFLKAWPLTANGKVNRQALPVPESIAAQPAELFVAPRTAVEEVLASIWSEVLGREQVSIHDDFFALGGHSLLAIQVLSRVRQAFRIEVPPRHLFTAPTVAGLAEMLRKHEARPGQVAAIARLRLDMAKKSADDIQTLLRDKGHTSR